MAARVNTKFVLLLSAVLVVLVGSAVGGYLLFFVQSPEELDAEGQEFVRRAVAHAQRVDEQETLEAKTEAFALSGQDYIRAADKFKKAFDVERTNVDLLLKYLDALEHIHVESNNAARNVLLEIDQRLRLATQLSQDEQILAEYYDWTLGQLLWGAGPEARAAILGRILNHVETKLEIDPTNRVALKYRGIASTLLLNPESKEYDDYQDAKDDLERAIELLPDDALIPMYLAKWHIAEARRVENDPKKVAEHVQAAKDISAAALAMKPDDTEIRFKRIEALLADPVFRMTQGIEDEALVAQIEAENEAIVEQVRGIVDAIEERLTADPRPMDDVLRLCDIMTRLDRAIIKNDTGMGQTTGGIQRTQALLEKAVEADPLNIVYRTYLGNIHKLQMSLDNAMAAYRDADNRPSVGPYDMMLRQMQFKRQARYEIANIALIQAETEQDPQKREAGLKIAEDAIDELEQVLDSKAPIFMLKGKVAMLRGNDPLAAQHMGRAVELFSQDGSANIEAMLLAARAYQRTQQWGAAASILESLVRLPGIARSRDSETRIRTQLTEIYLNANQFERAEHHLQALREGFTMAEDPTLEEDKPALAPDAPETAMLTAGLELKRGGVDAARTIYEQAEAMDNPQVVGNLARGYRLRGDNDAARALLRDFLDRNPADLTILNLYSQLVPGDAQARGEAINPVLDRALQAGASPEAIRALRAGIAAVSVDDTGSQAELVEALAGTAEDEVTAELRKAGAWKSLGDEDQARAAFRRAEALDANHPQVIMMGIAYAVQDNDQAKLDQLATRAAQANVDLAGGSFVRGQIAAAQKKFSEAITFYNEGLEKRPVFADGWKSLGDLYAARGSHDLAAEAYSTAVNQKPDNVAALVGLATAHRQRGRTSAELSALRDALTHRPGDRQLLQTYLAREMQVGNPERALATMRDVAAQSPNVVENQLAVALLLAESGRLEDAQQELDRIKEAHGDHMNWVKTAAEVARQSGDPQAGQKLYRDYLRQRAEDATFEDFLTAARFHRQTEASEAAITYYQQAAALDQTTVRLGTREFADYLFQLSRFEDAAAQYDIVLANGVADDEDRARLVRRQTETLLRLGAPDRAEALLADQPADPMVLMLRAMVAQQRNNNAQALTLLNQAIEANPDFAVAYMQRGMLRLTADAGAALADAERAIEIDGTLVPARRLRAQVLLSKERVDDAVAELSAVLALEPQDSGTRIALARIHLQRGDYDTGQEVIAVGQRVDPENPAWPTLAAQMAMAGGDDIETIRKLEEAVATDARPVTVRALAEAYLRADRPRDAVRLFEEHPTLVNASVLLQARRGQALIRAGNLQGGGRVLALAMQRAANRGQLIFVAQAAQTAVGTQRALELVDVGLNAQPAKRLGYDMAKAVLLITDGDFTQALEILNAVEPFAAESDAEALLEVRRMIALAYYQSGQLEQAVAAYRKLLADNPDDVESLNNLAFFLANDLDDAQAALPLAEKAVQLTQPPQASVMDTLGFVQLKAGDFETARRTLEEARTLRPLAAIDYHLALTYQGLGENELAAQAVQAAIDTAQRTNDQDTLEKARRLQSSL